VFQAPPEEWASFTDAEFLEQAMQAREQEVEDEAVEWVRANPMRPETPEGGSLGTPPSAFDDML
jgi:hypothetical protein